MNPGIVHVRTAQNAFVKITVGLLLGMLLVTSRPPTEANAAKPESIPLFGPTTAAEMADFAGTVIQNQMADKHIPGAAVIVVKDGQVFLAKGYGYADLEKQAPVDPATTLFRIGSVTKLFTWTAVMQLVEQGRLDLDADINSYLDFRIPATFDQPITLKHLMTHTAGFEDRNFELYAASVERKQPLGNWLKTHVPARVHAPGLLPAYSNYGAALAGYIVERVSGLTYEDYLEQYVLSPLRMTRTTARLPLPGELSADRARGYVWANNAYQPWDSEISQMAPAGAISGTATDVARFMLAHLQNGQLDGSRILKEDTARQMHKQLFTFNPRVNGFAYGFYEMSQNGQRVIGHAGDTTSFHCLMALVPAQDLGVFVVYNSVGGGLQPEEFLKEFMDHYYPMPQTQIMAADSGTLNNAARVAGSYRATRSSYTTMEAVTALLGPGTIAAAPDGTLLFNSALGQRRYAEVEPLVFRQIDGDDVMVFQADEKGRITHAAQSEYPIRAFEKLEWYESPDFQLPLLGSALVLMVSTLPVALIRLLRRSRNDKTSRLPKIGRRILVADAGMAILFLVGFGLVFANQITFLLGDILLLRVALLFPVLILALSPIAVAGVLVAWRSGDWHPIVRIYYSLVTFASLVFLWVLNYWNLIGWR